MGKQKQVKRKQTNSETIDPENVDTQKLLEVIKAAARKGKKGARKWLKERGLNYE